MTTISMSFHGGSSVTSINNILAATTNSLVPVLAPNASGSLPALSELRGFFAADNFLYVVNAYKDFSNILTFSPPASAGDPYTFAGLFAAGASDGLAHPFCAVLAAQNGDVYVSNQDVLSGQKSSAITRYEGPTKNHPGKYKGVFACGFTTLRGIATDGNYWYAADEGNSSNSGAVWILDSNGKRQNSLSIDQPVHLLYDEKKYLYIGSEAKNAVYRYDSRSGDTPSQFITSSQSVPIDHTAGLAISGEYIYVASRKTGSVNQYSLTDPSQASVYVKNLADEPEFLLFL